MKTIKEMYTNNLIIKNSQFICYLYSLSDSNINPFIDKIHLLHPKATHYCYAFIYDDIKHSSDDGEPGGTAGMPILNVLEKEGLNHILCIVVRYFGGIKLGAGGLVRAYTKSVTDTLKSANFIELESGYKISIQFNYDDEKDILYILKDCKIINKSYLEKITYICLINEEIINKLKQYNVVILEKLYIEKLN